MRKNVTIVLLGLLVLALAGINVRQRSKHRQARDTAPEAKPSATTMREAATPHKGASPSNIGVPGRALAAEERVELEGRIRQLESELASVRTAQETPVETPAASAGEEPPLAGLAEMLKNPGMKDMIRAQQKATMDMTHGSLFSYLTLSDEDLGAFKQLLLDKQMALIDASFDMMGSTGSQEEGEESGLSAKETLEAFDERIKAFLGEKDFAVYKEYEETQPERATVNLFKQSLGADDKISDEQEHELIVAMHEERTNFVFSHDFENQERFDPGTFNEEAMSTHMAELGRLQEKYLSRANEILTGTQLDQFKQSQEQMRSMQEMGLKMASQMFAKPSEKEE